MQKNSFQTTEKKLNLCIGQAQESNESLKSSLHFQK